MPAVIVFVIAAKVLKVVKDLKDFKVVWGQPHIFGCRLSILYIADFVSVQIQFGTV